MDESLKQRIIGAIVLVSCAVIFIPMIFDPDSAEQVILTSDIPTPPPALKVTIPQPQRPQNAAVNPVKPRSDYRLIGESESVHKTDTVEQPETKPVVADKKPVSDKAKQKPVSSAKPEQTKPSPVLAEDGLPNAWVVQVASFKDRQRAKALKQKLLNQGYKAFTRRGGPSNGESTRVYVGPKLEKHRAQVIKQTLDKELNVSSLIIKFRAEG